MMSSPVDAVPETDSEGAAGAVDSFGSMVTMIPAVSPFESVTEVPRGELAELHAPMTKASGNIAPVRVIFTAKRLNALRSGLFMVTDLYWAVKKVPTSSWSRILSRV